MQNSANYTAVTHCCILSPRKGLAIMLNLQSHMTLPFHTSYPHTPLGKKKSIYNAITTVAQLLSRHRCTLQAIHYNVYTLRLVSHNYRQSNLRTKPLTKGLLTRMCDNSYYAAAQYDRYEVSTSRRHT